MPAVPQSAPVAPVPPAMPAVAKRSTRENISTTVRSSGVLRNSSLSSGTRRESVERADEDVRHTVIKVTHPQQCSDQGALSDPHGSRITPPPPAPRLSVAPPPPPASSPTPSAHAFIAPTSRSITVEDSKEVQNNFFEALQPSLSTRIEAAVRDGKAAHPLKASRRMEKLQAEKLVLRIPREDKGTPACTSPFLEEAAEGDWASVKREERLQPLPASISESIEQHEIPVELGGEGSTENTTAPLPSDHCFRGPTTPAVPDSTVFSPGLAARLFETSAVERLPGEVWCAAFSGGGEKDAASLPSRDNSEVCVSVSSSVTPQQYAITVQLREPPSNAMAAVRAVAGALSAVESLCDAAVAAKNTAQGDSAPKAAPHIIVTWCALLHCPFFTAEESPIELSLSERVGYMEAKELVMKRFHHLVAQYGTRVRFTAVANTESVLDFGAEVFFACPERRLISPRRVACDGGDEEESPLASSSPSVGAPSVGFPLSRVGIFPTTSTVAYLQCLYGSFRTVKWIPVLHTYDVRSLADAGLLSLSDTPANTSKNSRWAKWSLRLERFILERFCQSPAQRQWVMETFLWGRGFHSAEVRHKVFGAMPADILEGWYAYAMGVLGRNPPLAKVSAVDSVCSESVAKGHKVLEASSCRGAAHATHVHTNSVRRSLPPLPHHRFLAFPHSQQSIWKDKVKSLTTTADTVGAALLLDCSERAVMDTVDLVKAHLACGSELRARLPYLNIVLIGGAAAAQPVLQSLPCAAVISSASAFFKVGHSAVQQVRLYASPNWPTDLQQDTLLSALTYLQRRRTPHVVAASAAPQRLLLALCEEAVLIARSLFDASAVESAAREELGLCFGPFQLMDTYGTAAIASMAADERSRIAVANDVTTRVAVTPLCQLEGCMRSMAREGLLGSKSARGGFYDPVSEVCGGSTASLQLRKGVLNAHVCHNTISYQVRDRLRAAVVNVACELLTHGEVQSVGDIDLLSMSALGWREETGGVLFQIDELGQDGLPRLVESMGHWAAVGAATHLAPHPLLLRMVKERVRFTNLKTSGLL